jgi:MerR HTH family regulatory protein
VHTLALAISLNADIYQHSSKEEFMRQPKSKPLYLHDVAAKIGVAPITLRRWLLAGKIPEVIRNRNGWRVFSIRDVNCIRRYANQREGPKAR